MKKLTIIAAVATGLALSVATSQAQVVLDNDTTLDITDTTSPGGSLNDELVAPFGPTGGDGINQQGTIDSYIVDNESYPSPYDGIAFAYVVNETGNDTVNNISLSGFDVSSVYVTYVADGSSAEADTANLNDGVLTISFNPSVNPDAVDGDSSGILYVFTEDPNATESHGSADDSYSANATPTYAPTTAVPEASTVMAGALMLLPLGIGAIRAVRKERTV